MRTPNLQYLYLQKPISFVVVLCLISVLPWIGWGELSTKASSEATEVATSILETGNWILPSVNETQLTYNPPLSHWLIAAFSYPQGYVSEFTSRLPSAIAYIVLLGAILMFFGKRIRFQQAFISVLLLLTGVGMHNAGMSASIHMLLTTFMALGIFRLFKWEDEMQLKGLPVIIPFYLSCAILTSGPVGVVLPLTIFMIYLLVLNKYRLLTVIKAVFYVGVASLFLPLLWYVAAGKQGGETFFNLALADHFSCFFGAQVDDHTLWTNLKALFIGFMPWTILVIFSFFGIKITEPVKSFKDGLQKLWDYFRSLDKVMILSAIILVCIGVFYLIPVRKPSVYLMLTYPFIALFLAQYLLYLSEYRRFVTRVFAGALAVFSTVALIMIVLSITGVIELVPFVNKFIDQGSIVEYARVLDSPSWITIFLLCLTTLAISVVWYQLSKKINIKILYSTIFLAFVVNMLFDSLI